MNVIELARLWPIHWFWRIICEKKLDVVQTNLCPDMVVWSTQVRKLIAIKQSLGRSHVMKPIKGRLSQKVVTYAEMMEECRRKGWTTRSFPVVVGCREFHATSMWKAFTALGITGVDMTGRSQFSLWVMLLRRNQAGFGSAETTKAGDSYKQTVADHHCCPTILECLRCKEVKHLMMYGIQLRMLVG